MLIVISDIYGDSPYSLTTCRELICVVKLVESTLKEHTIIFCLVQVFLSQGNNTGKYYYFHPIFIQAFDVQSCFTQNNNLFICFFEKHLLYLLHEQRYTNWIH